MARRSLRTYDDYIEYRGVLDGILEQREEH